MYLIDTCVFSEFSKPHPDTNVIRWARNVFVNDMYLSVLVLGEILRGIERLDPGHRKDALTRWVDSLFETHRTRLIQVDSETIQCWATLCSRVEKTGLTPPAMDSLIAASALSHNLTIVTRNVRDFEAFGIKLLNPWLP